MTILRHALHPIALMPHRDDSVIVEWFVVLLLYTFFVGCLFGWFVERQTSNPEVALVTTPRTCVQSFCSPEIRAAFDFQCEVHGGDMVATLDDTSERLYCFRKE